MIRRKELHYLALGLALLGLAFGLVAGASVLPGPASAAQPSDRGATAAAQRPETLVVRLYFHDVFERDRLAVEWGAVEAPTKDGYLTIWTDRATFNQMLAQGLRAEIDQDQTRQANNPNLFGQDSPDTFYGGYKTVEEMQAFLDQQVANHPTLAAKVDIGDSWCKTHPGSCTTPAPAWNGYDLWVLHITNQAIAGPKPVFWYDTGIHSREIATSEVAMRYISWLLDNYDTSADARWLVDYHDIWVMPMVNPDGHHMVEAGGNSPYLQRKNGDRDDGCTTFPPGGGQLGTDLNRNFPLFWGCCGGSSGSACSEVYRGPTAGSEEETQAVMNQIRLLIPDQRGPNNNDPAPITTTGLIQSMHSNAELNLFPWGWTSIDTPNDADMRNVAAHMSAPNAGGNGYDYGQPPEILYAVDGDSGSWGYGELGAPSYTTEISGTSFFPAYSLVDSIFTANKGALIYQAKVARTPYLTAHGPDANTVAANPPSVPQGTPSQLTASINYAWTNNVFAQNVGAAEYYLDTPPWAGGTAIAMNGTFTGQTVAVDATVSTGALSVGRHILFVRGRGVNPYSGHETWGPVSAVFLDVTAQGTPTPTPPAATDTPTATVPVPPTDTPTSEATATATATPTVCAVSFNDVPPNSTFYTWIRCLACRGIVGGYPCGGPGEPCPGTYYRPNNNVTRGQVSKIVSESAAFADPVPSTQQTFEDVPPSGTFWLWVERLSTRGIISGYPCGGPFEPCIAPDNRPYFRPNNNVTRGQLSKITSGAAGWTETPTGQTFEDVPPGQTFYLYVERMAVRGIISGYPCGGPFEPCVGPANRPYFRPNNNATRGQMAKIAAEAFFPNCQTPAKR